MRGCGMRWLSSFGRHKAGPSWSPETVEGFDSALNRVFPIGKTA
jgi:hypothetical protein